MAKQTNKSAKLKNSLKLSIKDIYIGEIDSTIEIDTGGNAAIKDFLGSYFVRNEEEITQFLDGRKSFVYGQKGVGKTAFLRYIGENYSRSKEENRHFDLYRFSKDFPEAIYEDITEYVTIKRQNKEALPDINIFRDLNYEPLWTYLIFRKFLENALKTPDIVEKNDAFEKFQSKLKKISENSIFSRFARLVPKVTNIKTKISTTPSAEMELHFTGGTEDFSKFNEFVEDISNSYKKLTFSTKKYYLMFDEIDPRVGSGKSFDLDCILIRDLIVAIYNVNRLVPAETRNVFYSAAIRSEVLRSVNRLGKEIHHLLEQLGIHMTWGEYGAKNLDHPLIKMICKKIAYSETKRGMTSDDYDRDYRLIWNKYFKQTKSKELAPKDLLRLTWLKPRDIVRLLKSCQTINGDSREFSMSLIDQSKTVYANKSWSEIQAQLAASASPSIISGVESLLSGFWREFTFIELHSRLKEQSQTHTSAETILKSMKMGDLLELLYFHGVIGCVPKPKNHLYYFEGHTSLPNLANICIHPALFDKFSTKSRIPKQNTDNTNHELF